jgi:phenylacetic acid degradation protein
MVGMNAVVMDGADIGSRALVGANAFIPAGLVVPPDHLAAGNPGKVIKELDAEALAWKANGIRVYQELARRSLASLVAVVPLREEEPDRPALPTTSETATTSKPLHEFRRRES